MRFLSIIIRGTLLGLIAGLLIGFIYGTITERLPAYQDQAAFLDGMYTLIHTGFAGFAGAVLGLVAGIAWALFRTK